LLYTLSVSPLSGTDVLAPKLDGTGQFTFGAKLCRIATPASHLRPNHAQNQNDI